MRSPRGLALGGALAVLLLTATGVVARNLASDPGAIERLVLLGRHERAEVVELPASVRDALRPDGSRRAETAAGREVLLDARGSLLVRVASSASPVTASFDDAPAPAEAVAVGPSLDSTDDPATESVYLLGADGTVYEYGPAAGSFVTLADGTATLVGTIDTSDGPGVGAWDPDSPDPSGITWWPAESRLVVVDGEVDEDTGAGFHDVNGWLSTTAGQVTATFDTTASTNEPVGVTVDTTTGSLYISEDSNHRVFELDPGADGEVGTADDSLGLAINTGDASGGAVGDPEGIAFANGDLYIADGADKEVYRFTRSGGIWVLAGQFDVAGLGQTDPEGIEYDPVRDSLFIVSNNEESDLLEVTLAGAVLNTFSLPFLTSSSSPGGVAVGPASDGSGRSVYIADRAVDNGGDSSENDGVIWEASLPDSGPTPTPTPVPTSTPTTGPTPSPTPTPTPTPTPSGPTVARISGADRYATAASLSSTLIDPNPPSTGGTVIVASGESFPDALAGAPAAFANDGPVLLVKAGSIPSPTLAELNRLAPDHVYVLGGTVAVSSAVENQLKSLASTPTVQRIAGVDRYATAAQLAATFFPAQKTVFLASGEAFPDALSAAGAASRRGWPILLTKRTSLPPSTCDRIGAADPTKIYVLGGTVAITDAVAAAAGNCSGATNVSVERLGGADRYATAALVNSEFFTPSNGDHVLVATGVNFPDALAAGAVGDPVFLTTTNDLPTVAFNAITGLDPSSIHVMGGTTVVSQAVVVELQGT